MRIKGGWHARALALAVIAPLLLAGEAATLPVVSSNEIELSALGACRSPAGAVDMKRLLFIENREMHVRQGAIEYRVRIERERVLVDFLNGPQQGSTAFLSVAEIVGHRALAEIELKFAQYEGLTAVYWRETFKYRMYRQGLLRLVGDRLVPWCEGQGGIGTSH